MVNAYNTYWNRNFFPAVRANFQAQKKSELKKIYTAITNFNKQTPLYMIKSTADTEDYLIGIKGTTIALQTTLATFLKDSNTSTLNKKVITTQPDAAKITILPDASVDLPEPFTLSISKLACPQINLGRDSANTSSSLLPGSYNFAVEFGDAQYDFKFNIKEAISDLNIQTKLATFINQSEIDLTAEVVSASDPRHSHLKITSQDTGFTNEPLFLFQDQSWPENSQGIANYFDLNQIATPSTNAFFLLNDEPKETLTNSFTLSRSLTVQLNQTTDLPISVAYTNDYDNVISTLRKVTQAYNNCVDFATAHSSSQKGAIKYSDRLKDIASSYYNELEACGISLDSHDKLKLDEALLLDSTTDNEVLNLLLDENGYIQALLAKTKDISINPMEFVNKTILTYPNTLKKPFLNPYITSMYSGMFFNYHC